MRFKTVQKLIFNKQNTFEIYLYNNRNYNLNKLVEDKICHAVINTEAFESVLKRVNLLIK
jgi:hypothetical protein